MWRKRKKMNLSIRGKEGEEKEKWSSSWIEWSMTKDTKVCPRKNTSLVSILVKWTSKLKKKKRSICRCFHHLFSPACSANNHVFCHVCSLCVYFLFRCFPFFFFLFFFFFKSFHLLSIFSLFRASRTISPYIFYLIINVLIILIYSLQ